VVHTGFGGEPEERRNLGIPRCGWEDNIERDLEETGWEGMHWVYLA
jgi:hypothetical protein